MGKILKIPAFFIKWLDAFIMRIPVSIFIIYGAFRLNGITNEDMEQMTILPIMLSYILPFALAWGFIYVAAGKPRSIAASGYARIGQFLITVGIFGLIGYRAINSDGIVPYLMNLGLPARIIIGWILYMLCSEFIKSRIAKKNKGAKGAANKKIDRIMDQFRAVSNAFVNMERELSAKSKGGEN